MASSQQLIEKSLRREKVDRLPVIDFGVDPIVIAKIQKIPSLVIALSRVMNLLPAELKNLLNYTSIKKGQEVMIRAGLKLGLDGVGIYTGPRINWVSRDKFETELGNIEQVNYGKMFEPPGVKGTMNCFSVGSTIKAPEEFLDLEFQAEDQPGVKMASDLKKKYPEIVLIPFLVSFQSLIDILGYGQLVDTIVNKPKLTKAILRKIDNLNIGIVNIMAGQGFRVFIRPEDFGSTQGLMYPSKELKGIIVPSFKRLVDTAHQKGAYMILHSCGNINDIIEDVVKVGFDGLHPLEPPGMDFQELKKRFGDKICLIGNVDSRKTLISGTRKEIVDETKEKIVIGGLKGHILGSSHSIHGGINLGNYQIFLKTAKKYGHRRWLEKQKAIKAKKYGPQAKVFDLKKDISWEEAFELRRKHLINPGDLYMIAKRTYPKKVKGKVLIGTAGSEHSPGREIVTASLMASGYEVFDIGGHIEPKQSVEMISQTKADILAISCVLNPFSTNITKDIVKRVKRDRPGVKIIIGGGAINIFYYDFLETMSEKKARKKILSMFDVNGFGLDEIEVVELCDRLLSISV